MNRKKFLHLFYALGSAASLISLVLIYVETTPVALILTIAIGAAELLALVLILTESAVEGAAKGMDQPRFGKFLIYLLIPKEDRPTVLGDFEELYGELMEHLGGWMASFVYWKEILFSISPFVWARTGSILASLQVKREVLPRVRLYQSLAAALFCALIVQTFWFQYELWTLRQPEVSIAVADLVPTDFVTRGETDDFGIESRKSVVFVLNTFRLAISSRYQLELLREDSDSLVWTTNDLQRNRGGSFAVLVPANQLAAGRYKFRVTGLDDKNRPVVEENGFEEFKFSVE